MSQTLVAKTGHSIDHDTQIFRSLCRFLGLGGPPHTGLSPSVCRVFQEKHLCMRLKIEEKPLNFLRTNYLPAN